MKYYTLLVCLLLSVHTSAQLTNHLILPRLDSSWWEKDFDAINAHPSAKANKFQNCIMHQTDTTRGRFCLNTTMGHAQLDTTLHNITPEKLTGTWIPIAFGTIQITDSLPITEKTYFRTQSIQHEATNPAGTVTFSADKIQFNLKNIDDLPNFKGSYTILDGKFLVVKKLIIRSTATIIGLTPDGILILDDHIYQTNAKAGQYLTVTTSIRRIMLKKS